MENDLAIVGKPSGLNWFERASSSAQPEPSRAGDAGPLVMATETPGAKPEEPVAPVTELPDLGIEAVAVGATSGAHDDTDPQALHLTRHDRN